MKKILLFILLITVTQANAKLGLFGGVYNITSLRYAPTIGLGLSVGVSNKQNVIYAKCASTRNFNDFQYAETIYYKPDIELDLLNFGYSIFLNLGHKNKMSFGVEIGNMNILYPFLVFKPITYSPNVGYHFLICKRIFASTNLFLPISKTERFSSDCGNGPQFNLPEKITCTPYLQIGFTRK